MQGNHWRFVLAAAILFLGATARGDDGGKDVAPNSADEPFAKTFSMRKATEFLDHMGTTWTSERQCGSCHSNYAYMIARPLASNDHSTALAEVREFFEDRVKHWDDSAKEAKPKWDAEVVATAVTLAFNDQATTCKLHPSTRQALDRMWNLQKPNGSFNWLKCNWPPYEEDDYYGATFATIGVAIAPDNYRDTPKAKEGLEKLRKYLRETPAPSLHHEAMKLWIATKIDGVMADSEKSACIKHLRELQRADGGWNLPSLGNWKRHDGSANDKNAPSDGFGTGFVVYVLRQTGAPADDPAIVKGIDWLKTHQRASGRWFTRSVNNDKAHYIAHAGSAFAVMALQSCGVKAD